MNKVQFQLLGESLNVVYKFNESLSLKNLSLSLKKIKTLEKEDYYTIAALACSYNETSLNRIIRDIRSMGFEIDPKITLNKIAGMLNSTQLKILESALMVLNLNLDVTFNEIV